MRLLTSRTVAKANPGVASPLKPGAACPRAKPPKPGRPPATPPAYGVVNGEVKLCMNGLLKTPGAPASMESAHSKFARFSISSNSNNRKLA